MAGLVVRDPRPADEADWRRLWAGYLDFYETDLPEAVTAATWSRILDPAVPVNSRLAERDGVVVGFANHVLHPGTWSIGPFCYLEDLYVDPEVRGTGAGRALIEDLVARGKAEGWGRVYWHTRETNSVARRLYDRFTPASGFVMYRIRTGEDGD
jgi:GNAT superfamily N-acetyltransferase